VYRIQRFSEYVDERWRYVLRATAIVSRRVEASREIDPALMRDKVRHGQMVPTPEATFEQLWQQLRLDLDAPAA
jgi:hypothetical protein